MLPLTQKTGYALQERAFEENISIGSIPAQFLGTCAGFVSEAHTFGKGQLPFDRNSFRGRKKEFSKQIVSKWGMSVDMCDDQAFGTFDWSTVIRVDIPTGKIWGYFGIISSRCFMDTWPGKRVTVISERRDRVAQIYPECKSLASDDILYCCDRTSHSSILNPECTSPDELVTYNVTATYPRKLTVTRGVENAMGASPYIAGPYSHVGCPHEKIIYPDWRNGPFTENYHAPAHHLDSAQIFMISHCIITCACEMFRKSHLVNSNHRQRNESYIYDTRSGIYKHMGPRLVNSIVSAYGIAAIEMDTNEFCIFI